MTLEEAIECMKYNRKIMAGERGSDYSGVEAMDVVIEILENQPRLKAIKDCRNCKHGHFNDHWNTYFCYNPNLCEDWDKWEVDVTQKDVADINVRKSSCKIFIGIAVDYLKPEMCPYNEYKGKPYYSIKYLEDGKTFTGYGTYNPEVLSQYLKEYFIQPVMPKPKVYCKECKHYEPSTWKKHSGWCNVENDCEAGIEMTPDDYCSRGERR